VYRLFGDSLKRCFISRKFVLLSNLRSL